MRKLSFILALFVIGGLLCGPAVRAGEKTLTATWNQTLSTDFAGWGLYQASASGGPYTLIADIPFTSAQTKYTFSKAITIADGTETTLYFVMDAYDKSGNRSKYSIEKSVPVDFKPPDIPGDFTLTFIMVVTPK